MKKPLKQQSPLSRLQAALAEQLPQHDTPVGVLHPYWARKPLNIVSTIINSLTKKHDVVFDPFVGSGTVAYASLACNRRVVASDLNPLSIFISKTILDLPSLDNEQLSFIKNFYDAICKRLIKNYQLADGTLVERIRYEVRGTFKNGDFKLGAKEVVLKRKRGNIWSGREVKAVSKSPLKSTKKFLNHPIKFEKIPLQENSRIAIPSGATLAHFFDEPNRSAINLVFSEIEKVDTSDMLRNALLFILSSSIPLLRLSDKKATSQWPYWRPKNSLTSRNPYFVIQTRLNDFLTASKWSKTEYSGSAHQDVGSLMKSDSNGFALFKSPAQEVTKRGIKAESIDLILTDPPYADQVPYLEYSELWNRLILGAAGGSDYSDEIVKTDAPTRKKDDVAYIQRLKDAFVECSKTLKDGGHFVFFYQDRSLFHWAEIYKTLTNQKLVILDVIALPKQRRSMKSVTSPGRTFDGDLLIVAQKQMKSRDSRVKISTQISQENPNFSFFEKYACMIKNGLVHGQIEEMASQCPDIFLMIDKAA